MKKNYIAAFLLSMGVLFLWDHFYMKPRREAPVPPAREAGPLSAAPAGATAAGVATPAPAVVAREANVVLELGDSRITFNRFGAGVSQWELKEEKTNGRWVPIVPKHDGAPLPLVTFPEIEFALTRDNNNVVFTGKRADGLRVVKTFHIDPAGHLHNLQIKLQNTGAAPVDAGYTLGWGPGIEAGDEPGEGNRNTSGAQRAIVYDPPKLTTHKEGTYSGPYQWWGVDGHYFLAAFVDADRQPVTLRVQKWENYFSAHKVTALTLAPGGSAEDAMPLFVGPKGYEYLKSFKLGFEKSVNFGAFAPIGRLIHKFLRVAYRATQNYGWSIILLTLLIQTLVLPLTIKSFQHGQKMKAIQPQMKRLQEQHKNNPQRLNTEMLALYKRHGLKFMGMEGCFPILIQLPVFWALFSTLRSTYELRHAPWIGWVRDLSAHDPFYVLPVLMGGGMYLQQKMSTATMDPAQQKIMMLMPVIFTFFFLKMPAGLVLYWLTSSIISISVNAILLKRANAQGLEAVK